jgi:hypothetical protein
MLNLDGKKEEENGRLISAVLRSRVRPFKATHGRGEDAVGTDAGMSDDRLHCAAV